MIKQASIAAFLLLLAACAQKPEDRLALTKTDFSTLSGWQEDDASAAFVAWQRSCERFALMLDGKPWGQGIAAADISHWKNACQASRTLLAPTSQQVKMYFEQNFTPWVATNNGKNEGLFTGYYQPLLRGSRTQKPPYNYPIYGLPTDLTPNVPYLTRAEIDKGALQDKNLEIAWVEDPVALFFLHVQGSGAIALEEGETLFVGYAGKNGHAYVAIGKKLVERGEMTKEQVTLFTIREWLRAHPDQAPALMQENPSYVFFKAQNREGAYGAQGVVLTPDRSLAVDPRFIPYGTPLFLETALPETPKEKSHVLQRLMVAQDTGSAIKGPIRGDIFFGSGEQAEAWAGLMKGQGRVTLLLPNGITPREP